MTLLLMVASSGCAGGDQIPRADPPPSPASSFSAADPSRSPGTRIEARCGETAPSGVRTADATLRSRDGVRLSAAVLGTGPRGVVLLHQTDDGICGWFPYAGYLATRGFQVLAFDRRCTGNSTCPSDAAAGNHAADVGTAVAELMRRGAAKVAVVGASLGGAVAIGSCAVVPTSGCVALSPAIFDLELGRRLTATTGITRVRVPLMIAVAPDDPDSSLAEVRAVSRRARPGVAQLIELPAGAGHGWDTVHDPADPTRRSAFSDELVDFLQQRLT